MINKRHFHLNYFEQLNFFNLLNVKMLLAYFEHLTSYLNSSKISSIIFNYLIIEKQIL